MVRDVLNGSNGDQKWAHDILKVDGTVIVLQEILEILRILVSKLEPKRGLSSMKQSIIWPFSQSDIEAYLSKIGRCKQNVMLAFQMQDRNNTSLILNRLDALAIEQQQISSFTETQALRDELRIQVEAIAWLSTFDYQKKHAVASVTRLDGTARWIFTDDRFKNWYSGDTNTLFCFGGPGVGKTIIASSIIDRLRELHENEEDVAVMYMYLDYKEREEQRADSVISILPQQLMRDRRVPLRRLQQLYMTRSDPNMKHPDMKDVCELLEDTMSELRKVYLVVDAFDESESTRTQDNLTEYFTSL